MPSLELSVKSQFAKVFTSCDWKLFKDISEINFSEAALLKKSSFRDVLMNQRLLIRNIRKRLFIGIGTELLLKAVYLKNGYAINKPLKNADLTFPFLIQDASVARLNPNETYMLSQLIDNLKKVILLSKQEDALEGLRVAKVFRNKEGHVVTSSHTYDPANYRVIESALVEIYACAFNEKLEVQFSLEHNKKGVWHVCPNPSNLSSEKY